MTDQPTFTLTLAKEDFKFSCGHFTIFGPDHAEFLHGHNYHVTVELSGHSLDEQGLLADFVRVKTSIRAACERLDSHTLIPNDSDNLDIRRDDGVVEIAFGDREYRFPRGDVILIPEVNTSIEVLARMLWRQLAAELAESHVEHLGVCVSETAGQACWYRAPCS